MATIPRIPDEPISANMIAGAIANMRFDRVVSVKIQMRPTVGMVAKDVDLLGLDIKTFREPLTKAIKRVIIPSIKKNFEQGGRPEGWDPLAPATIVRRGYSAWPILEVTGRLKRAATSFGIWDVGVTSAIVRRLPADVYYGYYHQAGAEGGKTSGLVDKLMAHVPGSAGAEAIISKFVPAARRELGPLASEVHVHNRAVGLLLDSENAWSLPARPYIMYQDEDIPKIEEIFIAWMTDRAVRVGRFINT
jgi:phage gpG-like protein